MDVLVILGEFVTIDTRTGCVHSAPGHGQEDYQAGLAYGLEIASPVDDQGRFTSAVPQYEGLGVFDANERIVRDLQAQGILLQSESIRHLSEEQCPALPSAGDFPRDGTVVRGRRTA